MMLLPFCMHCNDSRHLLLLLLFLLLLLLPDHGSRDLHLHVLV